MINCPKCGAENMIGAIFCRTCSSKLDLDELRPEDFEEKEETLAKKAGAVAQRILVVLISVLVVGVLVLMMLPVSGLVDVSGVDQRGVSKSVSRFRRMHTNKLTSKYRSLTFEDADLTALANFVFGLRPGADPVASLAPEAGSYSGQGSLTPEFLSVEMLDGGKTRLILRALLFGKLPVYCTLLGRLEVVSGGGVTFTSYSAKFGKMPLPGSLKGVVVDNISALFLADERVGRAQKVITGLEISTNTAKVSLKVR
ncbi:MAG: zinc ribbon domain-containing protein [Lentisphaerae bacterium]|jgi:ribosomal protein L40E|nr:zinc ribbon domain-containing protein [Lentisphaerota bacterium]MBT4818969.1 zinc ribbon domain-containing protein [Lentisphaerota bacterium]MBT5610646.1 zinc ribbon domain-containing protein [Lentisphaerota bacterium]MBT7057303.1 zinc ribbon domain-containing protein [Lentisphaerota bacterium]MBT7841993.1 zinc ribbon domain-containing protein [Lentisphaerota bacterium]